MKTDEKADHAWIKTKAFNYVVSYIYQAKDIKPGSVFNVIDLDKIYLEQGKVK